MPKLTKEDFDYHKGWIGESEQEHKHMLEAQMPDDIMDAYESRICERTLEGRRIASNMIENYIFIASNTVVPTLFYQVPRPIIRGKRDELSYSAAVIEGLIRAYFTDQAKKEIQNCIIDAFLPYPYAVMKVGYNSRRGKYTPKTSILTGQTTTQTDTKSMEASEEYLKYEKPFIERISPRYAWLDHTKEFGKGRRVTFQYERNLQEIINSNLYPLASDFIGYFKSKERDNRKVKLKLKEHWAMINGYAWKLVYTEDWHDEIYWGKTEYKELPCVLMRFNDLADRLYTVSHGYLAHQAQKELDYENHIWKEHIDKIRRQHLVWKDALAEGGDKTLRANEIDGIVYTSKPVNAGVYAQISSNTMGKDVYAGIENIRSYLKLLLSTSGGKGGETEAEFAYTEKQQAIGDFMRTSGLQDTIRDFVREILRKEVSTLTRFGDPEVTVKITGKDIQDPVTGELITGREVAFGGENGLNLKDEIKGDVDSDYIYDIDITSAMRPDFAVIRKQMAEFLTLVTSPAIETKLAQEGKKFNVAEFVQDYANSFETLVNPQKYIQDLTEEDKQALALSAQAPLAQPPGATEAPETTEEAMAQGLEQIVKTPSVAGA